MMERILKILVISIFVFLLILWIATVFNTCNKDKNMELSGTELVEDTLGSSDDIDLTEDIFDEDSTEIKAKISTKIVEDNNTSMNDKLDDYIDYTGDASKSTTKTKVKKVQNSGTNNKTSTKPIVSSQGSYLVVAGSYLVEDNAKRMQKRLYDLGYNSEIVNFNLSQYYTVIAGRYNSRKEAQSTVSILKRNGIDSYVHKRKK